MCSLHDCCDHGIHSERNTPSLRHRPDRPRQMSDSSFGSVTQTAVSQPREVTRLSSRPDRHDRRRDNPLHSHSDSHMNSRSDINSNSKHAHVVISGKLQGFFFSKWTVENATKLGVNGWVRNCKDGTVEAVFSGKPSAVDHLLEKCKSGPSGARVANVAVTPAAGSPRKGFEQLDDKRW